MHRQKGFLEELILVTPLQTEMVAISLWEDKESAEAYHREFYPEVAKLVTQFAAGTPIIRNFEVEYATYRKFATLAV